MFQEEISAFLPNFPGVHLSFFFFSFSAEQWHELPNFPNPNKWGYSMVSLNNDVYVTGGSSVSSTETLLVNNKGVTINGF